MYSASVPVLRQMLGSLSSILDKAAAHATERKFEPVNLLQSRLSPDMFNLTRQVQVACDFAKGIAGRLAGVELPVFEDSEQGIAELQVRIAQTLEFLGGLKEAAFEGSETREIVLRPGTPKERTLSGQDYLFAYGLPQFFFHMTTAYALLRHNGVQIGKLDYMGAR
jgi:hypothetical protein